MKSSKLFVCVGFGWFFFGSAKWIGNRKKTACFTTAVHIKPSSFFYVCHLIADAERLHQTGLGTVVKAMMVVILNKKKPKCPDLILLKGITFASWVKEITDIKKSLFALQHGKLENLVFLPSSGCRKQNTCLKSQVLFRNTKCCGFFWGFFWQSLWWLHVSLKSKKHSFAQELAFMFSHNLMLSMLAGCNMLQSAWSNKDLYQTASVLSLLNQIKPPWWVQTL